MRGGSKTYATVSVVVYKVVRTRCYLFIYTSHAQAHVVPRRAFADVTEWEAFDSICRQRVLNLTLK